MLASPTSPPSERLRLFARSLRRLGKNRLRATKAGWSGMEEENTALMKLTQVNGFLFLPIGPKCRALRATTAQSVSRCTVTVGLKIVQRTCERRKGAKNNHARGGEKESTEEENGTAQAVTQKAAGAFAWKDKEKALRNKIQGAPRY